MTTSHQDLLASIRTRIYGLMKLTVGSKEHFHLTFTVVCWSLCMGNTSVHSWICFLWLHFNIHFDLSRESRPISEIQEGVKRFCQGTQAGFLRPKNLKVKQIIISSSAVLQPYAVAPFFCRLGSNIQVLNLYPSSLFSPGCFLWSQLGSRD